MVDISKLIEVRGHARGGQGMVTAFEILAKIFSYRYNYEVQAFPFFGVERTGAPIQAYLRISPETILTRNYIYEPHLIIIFDEGLIEQTPVFDGLTKEGTLLINSNKPPEYFKGKAKHIYTIPATDISVENKLGSKTLPIVNAAMVGAMLKILGADIGEAMEIIKDEVPAKPDANAASAETAFRQVKEFTDEHYQPAQNGQSPPAGKEPNWEVPFWDQPMSINKTGNWRVVAPKYEDLEAPCTDNCPAGTNVRKFVKLASEGMFKEAYETIYEHNPFPAICGRVCPHFCQQNCNRIFLDDKVNIGAIERFIGDKNGQYQHKPEPVQYKEKIAVVGSGPAGLTAALRLRKLGYEVTVYEALPKAGGMMRSGIPAFRLPPYVLDKEIEKIQHQGVEIITEKRVTIDELDGKYSAIITAVGSHIGSNLRIGSNEQVIDGIEFLRKLNISGNQEQIKAGDSVAVIGGGNTAIDVARTVLRLGGKPTIYYRRTRQEMPAIAEEVEEAMKEGVPIQFLTAPVGLEEKNGRYELIIQKMELGEPDESGRRRPVPVEGSEYSVMTDKLIKAIGQWPDPFVFSGNEIEARQGRLDEKLAGSKTPVFCAGDMAWGGTVVEAIGSGNDVAGEVDAFLREKEWEKPEKAKEIATHDKINYRYYLPTPGNPTPVTTPENFVNNFAEVAGGLPEDVIIEEAGRCLHCGECFSCGNCLNYCPDAAIFIDDDYRLRIDYDYCKGCGICVRECPCAAIQYDEKNRLSEEKEPKELHQK